MRHGSLALVVVTVAALVPSASLSHLDRQQSTDGDVSSFLQFFENQGELIGKTEINTPSPKVPPRRKAIRQVSQESTGEKNGKNEKCSCRNRETRRLKREIKDISFRDCPYQGVGLEDERIIQLSNITMSPKPLIIPGTLLINFDLEVRRQLPQDVQVDVDVYKYIFDTLPVNVPCMTVSNTDGLTLGSCTYRNVCQAIAGSACPSFQANGIPCQCESITPGKYSFHTPLAFITPTTNSIFDVLVKGKYKMRTAFTDARTKKEFGCVEVGWTTTKVHREDKDTYRSLFFKKRNRRSGT